jgi:toxin ParE1/3/4
MTLHVILRPMAQDDVLEARNWYEQQRRSLGDAFGAALREFLGHVQALPEIHAEAFKGVRRGKLRKFPYVVYYRVLAVRIEVIAVLHGGRDPRIWQARARRHD